MPRSRIACTLALILALTAIPAAIPAWATDQPDTPVRTTLPNGLRVVIVPNRLAPVVTTELTYLAGSNDAPPGFPGTAHALEHMMFRGSEGLDKEQLVELSARLGGRYNASTTETVTRYTYTVPAADLALPLRIEALRMRGITLSPADWNKERGAIEQEVARDLSSPFYNFMAQTQAVLFAETPYQHDALGTRASFEQTDTGLLRRFYDTWYAPNNAILVICGDVEPNAALAQAAQAFGAIPARPLPPHPAIAPRPMTPQSLTLDTNFPTGMVAIAFRMPGLDAPDSAAADILSDVLSSQRGRLHALVPAGKALMARFAYTRKADVGIGLALAAFPTGTDPQPLLAELRRILADTAEYGVSPALIAAAKRQELARLAFRANSIQGQADAWTTALALQRAQSPDDIAAAYRAVTVEDVNRLARQLLDPAHALTATLIPRRAGAPVETAGFGSVESPAEAPTHPVTLPDWAAAALDTPHPPANDAPPSIETLPNGLTLIIQPEHVSHTVSVFGQVREVSAMQEPAGKEGVAALTRHLFAYGTQRHDRLAFQEAADDLGVSIHAGSEFSLAALTPDFTAGMRLLAENMLHPAFPEQAALTVRAQLAHTMAGKIGSPGYEFGRAVLKALLPGNDPALRRPTPDSILALQPQDVWTYYRTAYRPDLTTIVIIGDVSPDDARHVVQDTFGAWTAEGPAPAIDLPPCPPNPTSSIRVPDPSAVQATIDMAETVQVPVTSFDRYPLVLGNAILTSGFSSRLYQQMRVHGGEIYTLRGDLDWGRTRATYGIAFGADPARTEKLQRVVLRNLLEMQQNPVSDSELARAKAQVMRRIAMRAGSVNEIAARYLHLAALGLPLESPEEAARHHLPITASEIQEAFARWIRPNDMVHVVQAPQNRPPE
ncbi:MAG TPA: insulinase family protein [Rhodopila sp.]|nr:insulinase family protein [Rhodopila sp.]